jgi:hypothetical protein
MRVGIVSETWSPEINGVAFALPERCPRCNDHRLPAGASLRLATQLP